MLYAEAAKMESRNADFTGTYMKDWATYVLKVKQPSSTKPDRVCKGSKGFCEAVSDYFGRWSQQGTRLAKGS